jgi:hypothetical protein
MALHRRPNGHGRSLQAFWNQFQVGDSSIDVYSSLRRLVMVHTNGQNQSTILNWESSTGEFMLFLRNNEVTDLVTSVDEWDRPTFEGSYNAQQEPQVEGWVDVSPDGHLMVEIGEVGGATTRYYTNTDGSVSAELARRYCVCSASLGGHCPPRSTA